MNPTSPDVIVLLAVRLAGRGTAERVETVGRHLGDEVDVAEQLAAAVALGQVRIRGEEGRHSLTPVGEAELSGLLAHQAEEVGRADLVTAYEAFLPLNRAFLETLSATQGAPLDRLAELVDDLDPVLASLADQLVRFAAYRTRFAHAVRQAAGDPRWIESPRVDSIHTVWFELHEHLLATLGRDRATER